MNNLAVESLNKASLLFIQDTLKTEDLDLRGHLVPVAQYSFYYAL